MNDTDDLRARSIELAERAFRLRDTATESATKQRLHAAGNELIMIDSPQRFYDAQSRLEADNSWSENQRSLAHEANIADQILRSSNSLEVNSTLALLGQWANNYQSSTNPEIVSIGESIQNSLDILNAAEPTEKHKEALSYLMSIIEAILAHIDGYIPKEQRETTSPLVIMLRKMRDSMLVARELTYDEEELLRNYEAEGAEVERLAMARHSLDEIYKTIQPITLP